jgi:hypothetical protein
MAYRIWHAFRFWLLLTITATAAADVGLQTRKGIIYGQQTQYSNEYLG